MDNSNTFIQPFIRSNVLFSLDMPMHHIYPMYTLGIPTDPSCSIMYQENSFPRNIPL